MENLNEKDNLKLERIKGLGKPTILCIDDEKIVLDSLKAQLKSCFGDTCHIEIAESGYEAMDIVNDMYENMSKAPSVVICDQIMPNIKGDRLLAQIKILLPKTSCILLTGQASKDDVISVVNNAGLYRYISKPWNVEDLNLTVKQALIANQKEIELELVNEQLTELNRNLEIKILERAKLILQQKEELEKKNREVSQSLNYAKRIQDALLPVKIKENLPDHFLIFRPQNMVSGDFYWFKKVNDLLFVAVVDCTGHGIPGALMSILGLEFLFNTIVNKGIYEPQDILAEMHRSVVKALKQKSSGVQDGMEMTICCIDTKDKVLKFSGAKSHLLYIDKGEKKLNIMKGNSLPIGGMLDFERKYKQYRLDYNKEMVFYLSSDGYYDQFGGAKNKKFSRKAFMKLIEDHYEESMEKQQKIFIERLDKWQGTEEQIDDITVFGFKIPE